MSKYLFSLLLLPLFLFADCNSYYDAFIDQDPGYAQKQSVDLVLFSYDRPMQLYALLESCERYIQGVSSVHVVLRASNPNFYDAYKTLFKRFDYVTVHKQNEAKNGFDFKKKLLDAIFSKSSPSKYVLFAVDDIIVCDFINLGYCIECMQKAKPYCFSLRMGGNIHLDTMLECPTPPPHFSKVQDGVYKWKFSKGKGGWNYPHSLDMTIYRKKDIKHFFRKGEYMNPNSLEGAWSKKRAKKPYGLCFKESKAVNIPTNVVNELWTSPSSNISVEELLSMFENDYKIDIDAFFKKVPYATHVDYPLTFTKRN